MFTLVGIIESLTGKPDPDDGPSPCSDEYGTCPKCRGHIITKKEVPIPLTLGEKKHFRCPKCKSYLVIWYDEQGFVIEDDYGSNWEKGALYNHKNVRGE